MDTLRELYKVGPGPSSSHTMGPQRAATRFYDRVPGAHHYAVELWGSLAATGKGHLTDYIIIQVFQKHDKEIDVVWKPQYVHPFHTNGMKFFAYDEENNELSSWVVFSVGGGTILEEGEQRYGEKRIYELEHASQILEWCEKNGKAIWEYAVECEGPEILSYMDEIWSAMKDAVQRGLRKSGTLPGTLNWPRHAKEFWEKAQNQKQEGKISFKPVAELYAYTLAVSEENGGGGMIVTAPTCGASGVLPGLLTYFELNMGVGKEEILRALTTAGIFGNIVKSNASISGAEAGCQAEVGVACSMAAAAAVYLMGGDNIQQEYAAEIGLEHHLGLTCDPIRGYVQSPCIERNAVAAVRALDAAQYAMLAEGKHMISFDTIVRTMMETGRDLQSGYRETSEAGLAKIFEL